MSNYIIASIVKSDWYSCLIIKLVKQLTFYLLNQQYKIHFPNCICQTLTRLIHIGPLAHFLLHHCSYFLLWSHFRIYHCSYFLLWSHSLIYHCSYFLLWSHFLIYHCSYFLLWSHFLIYHCSYFLL